MKNNLECHLEDPNSNELLEKEIIRLRKLRIILFFIILFLVIIIIVFIILYFTKGKKEDSKDSHSKEDSPNEPDEEYPEYSLYCNITTAENKTIKNSFKKDGENYIEEFGNVNNGKDYEETDRDNFDLSIPYTAANKKNYKTIILYIHGGGWITGQKADALEFSKSYVSNGFMFSTMSYTLLNGEYKEYNIFRIIDEINAVIKN